MWSQVFNRRILAALLTLFIVSPATIFAENDDEPSRREAISCALAFGLFAGTATLAVSSAVSSFNDWLVQENKKVAEQRDQLVKKFDHPELAEIVKKILDTEMSPKNTPVVLFDNLIILANSDVSFSIDDTLSLIHI